MGDVLVDAVSPSAVHLCVDLQRIFSSDGPWPTPWRERVLPTVTRIAERFPAHHFGLERLRAGKTLTRYPLAHASSSDSTQRRTSGGRGRASADLAPGV